MIVTDLANLRKQAAITPNLEKAIAYLEASGQDDLPVGKVVVDGTNVFVEVQAYDSIEGPIEVFEGHRKYLDIQYVAAGEEIIGWTAIENVTVTTDYVDEHDYWLGSAPAASITPISLKTGQLALLYPEDAHAPRRASGSAGPVRKLVVKVAID